MDKKTSAIAGWYELECYLYSNKQIQPEARINMAYGALNAARLAGAITWERQHELLGNFVANIYNIEIYKK